MKHVGSFFSKVAAYGVAFLITSLVVSIQAQQPGTAKVMAIKGAAEYSDAGGPWQKLMVGKVLQAGATIKTAVASQVDLFLKQNGPVVRVTEDTTLLLDTLTYEDTGADIVINTKLDLKNGRIQGNVKKMAAASSYQVKIPNGTVGIRGTKYDISANGKVHCIEGDLVVRWITPQGAVDYPVTAGSVFTPATTPGGTPTVTPESADYVPPSLPDYAGFVTVQLPSPEIIQLWRDHGIEMGPNGLPDVFNPAVPPAFNPALAVENPVSPTTGRPGTNGGGGSGPQ